MKAKSLYIQTLTYDENNKEKVGLFPSEVNPVIVSSYTYSAKRMGGAPTLTATIYTAEPLQWKKNEFVEFEGDRLFASYTPNPTKDNSSRMWKHEITFTSRRELLDNTLFFDVVVDDLDTQNRDRYRSNQTKFTFGGTIYEFVARINSSMAYSDLYHPKDEYKGYYVVVDEGYGTDEVKEVSFEDQYLTDVLQLIYTTFELTYYWVGNVCHVGKVQNDLTATPIKYGRNDALLSVSKENANYKIVDAITGYGSSDNLPYYYPNDNEYGEAVFETENIDKSLVKEVDLGKVMKWEGDFYNRTFVFGKNKEKSYTANVFGTSSYLISNFGSKDYTGKGAEAKNITPVCSMGEDYTESNFASVSRLIDNTTIWMLFEFTSVHKEDSVKMDGLSFLATETDDALKFGLKFDYEQAYYIGEGVDIKTAYGYIKNNRGGGSLSESTGGTFGNGGTTTGKNWSFGDEIDGLKNFTKSKTKDYTFEKDTISTVVVACKITANNIKLASGTRRMNTVSTKITGNIDLTHTPSSVYYLETEEGYTQPYEESGIVVNDIESVPSKELTFTFDGTDWNASEGGDESAAKLTITDRIWFEPSNALMPSIYRKTKGVERFYYATKNPPKEYADLYIKPGTDIPYEFTNLYTKGNPHQGSVTFDGIKPTINGVRNDVIQEDGLGQLFGEIADVAFDTEDSDVKDSSDQYIHSYFYIKLHKFSGDYGFDLFAHALANESAKINLIKSNGCPACSFTIGCCWDKDKNKCYNNVLTDGNGNLATEKSKMNSKGDYILNDDYVKEQTSNQDSTKEELWICVQKDTSTLGIVMPNASGNFKPQKGDLFVITGIKPPKVLVTAAEKRLDEALIKYMSENNEDQFNYSVKFSRIFLQQNQDFASKLNENTKLSLQVQGDTDSDGNLVSHEVFVNNYSVKVESDILAEVEVELVNSLEVTQSDVKQIIDAVKGETVKQLGNLTGGGNNSFNASVADKFYLSKQSDDTAQGLITFLKGLVTKGKLTAEEIAQFKKGATFGDEFIQGMLFGTGARIDERGNAEFESIMSRSSIIAKELIVNRQTAMESNFVFTESGMVETVTEIPATGEDGNTTYELTLQKRWDNDFTAFRENDVVLASINTLLEDGKYYDMWLRVLSVNTVTNTITVVCYPDDECPSGKNYPPCELARLIRWGSATDEDRQSCWYISSSEGLLVWLDHVTKPIIDKTNYSLAMGKLPDALGFIFQQFPTADKRDGAFYAKWMMAGSFQQIDYQGNPIYTTRDRGVWSLIVAQSDNPYRNGDGTIDTVYHLGCKWQCLKDKTTKPPTYSSTDWAFLEGNPYFTLEMISSKYWSFRLSDITATNEDGSWKVFTTLSVRGMLYNQDVTDSMTNVIWTRDSGNPTLDNKWALSHANVGNSLPITYEDLGLAAYSIGSVTFTCTAEIKDGETLISEEASATF